MTDRYRILVLCTGNSARSILGEALFNRLGAGRVEAHSAGSQPKGAVHPAAIRMLAEKAYDPSTFCSKSWNEFSDGAASHIDLAITVCGNAAGENCPIFSGAPLRAHWGVPDPAEAAGTDAQIDAAFRETYRLLKKRVEAFLALPFEIMASDDLKYALAVIGRLEGAA